MSAPTQSALPRSTSRTACSWEAVKRQTTAPGLPSGCAACDHSRKNRFRTNRSSRPFELSMRYGPVPGTGREPLSRSGVPGGTGAEKPTTVSL